MKNTTKIAVATVLSTVSLVLAPAASAEPARPERPGVVVSISDSISAFGASVVNAFGILLFGKR